MIDSKAQYYSFVKMISEHSLLDVSGSRERGRTRDCEAATSPCEGDTGTGIGAVSDQIVTCRAKHKESYDENIAAHGDFALPALLSWAEDLVPRSMVSMRPKYRAGQIAAAVAASGYPSVI